MYTQRWPANRRPMGSAKITSSLSTPPSSIPRDEYSTQRRWATTYPQIMAKVPNKATNGLVAQPDTLATSIWERAFMGADIFNHIWMFCGTTCHQFVMSYGQVPCQRPSCKSLTKHNFKPVNWQMVPLWSMIMHSISHGCVIKHTSWGHRVFHRYWV